MVDSAILFEGVNNALKLVATVPGASLSSGNRPVSYGGVGRTIIRKLETLDGIYGRFPTW
jgi:hypothetical protein